MVKIQKTPLLPDSIKQLVDFISKKANPQKIILFGSRARGDHRPNSDFDLCVVGKKVTDLEYSALLLDVKELPFTLYGVDLVEFESLSPDYRTHIKNEGITLYESNN